MDTTIERIRCEQPRRSVQVHFMARIGTDIAPSGPKPRLGPIPSGLRL
jgi:hypothetical protein